VRTNRDVSAVSVGKFVDEEIRVFVNPCSSVRERQNKHQEPQTALLKG